MKITLAGEEIELKFTFKRIGDIEKEIGSMYSYPPKCVDRTVTVSEIVSIYYNAQEAAYSREKIFEKIMSDGLVSHITITYDIVMRLSVGKKVTEELEAAEAEAKAEAAAKAESESEALVEVKGSEKK